MTKCKYCNREGNYSLGFLDRNGIWQDKHVACEDHVQISLGQQRFKMGMEDLQALCEQFGKTSIIGSSVEGKV